MAEDHFERFKQGLQAARSAALPTRNDRIKHLQEDFAALMSTVGQLNELLDEHQPTSQISWQFSEYDQKDDSLLVNLTGRKINGTGSQLTFYYQSNRLFSDTQQFKDTLRGRSPIWTAQEQDDLGKRISAWFTTYFSTL